MKVLVIGGTRFIGRATALRLFQEGHAVAVLNRGKTAPELPDEILRIQGDRDKLGDSKAKILDFAPDVVLHNIVIHDGHITELQGLVQGVAKRVVMTSSIDVYKSYGLLTGIEKGPILSEVQDESAPLREVLFPYRKDVPGPEHPLYVYDKIPAEQATLRHDSLEGVVLRLPMVFGPRDWQYRLFDRVKPMIDGREFIIESDEMAQWRTNYAYVDNVAKALALACVKPEAAGQIYNVSDGIFSNHDLVKKVQSELNWTGQFMTAPLEKLPEEFSPGFETNQHLLFSDDKIRKELGYQPEVTMDQAIKETVAWLKENPPENMDEELVHYKKQDKARSVIEES